jgi:ElaB/YqjD/DUF883 family membrane-anchored ribosome-binding protein
MAMKMHEPLVEAAGNRVSTDKIVADLRVLAADTEELLRATADQTGQRVAAARGRADESLLAARAHMADARDAALAKARAAGRATDGYVHANPWQVIAVSAFAGLVIGALLTRAGSSDN